MVDWNHQPASERPQFVPALHFQDKISFRHRDLGHHRSPISESLSIEQINWRVLRSVVQTEQIVGLLSQWEREAIGERTR
jgi:hypothetical protein